MTPTNVTIPAVHSALPDDPGFDPTRSTLFVGPTASGKTYAVAEALSKFPDADAHVVSDKPWRGGWIHQGLHVASATSTPTDVARSIANVWAAANVRDEEHRPEDQRRIILVVEEIGTVLDALSGSLACRSRETGEIAYNVQNLLMDLLIHGHPIDVTLYFTTQHLKRVPRPLQEGMQIVETVFPDHARLRHNTEALSGVRR